MKGLKILFSTHLLSLPIFCYAGAKLLLKRCTLKDTFLLVRLLLALTFFTITFLFLLLNTCYYEIANFILLLRYGRKYLGIMDGADRIWIFEDKTKAVISALYMFDAKSENSPQELRHFLMERYEHIAKTHPRLSCIKQSALGYSYFLRTDFIVSDIIKFLPEYNDMEQFQAQLDHCCNSDLPLGHRFLWEVYVGQTPLEWPGQESKQIPVFVRYNHCAADGLSLVTMMSTNLLRNGLDTMRSKCMEYAEILKRYEATQDGGMWDKCRSYFKQWNNDLVLNILFKPEKNNVLHGPTLCGKKHICWSLEKENENLIGKVKRIKNKYATSFDDVIFACIASSVTEYCSKLNVLINNDHQRKIRNPPIDVTAIKPFFHAGANLSEMLTIKGNDAVAHLGNKYSMSLIKLPIGQSGVDKSDSLARLKSINGKTAILKKNSLDLMFSHWQLSVLCSLIPNALLKRLVAMNDATMGITNVPGTSLADLMNGYPIRDTICFANNYMTTGITFTVFSYDNRIRLSLLVDKVLIEDRNDVQALVDNVFKHINRLDEPAEM